MLDCVYAQFYNILDYNFEGCDIAFKRELMSCSSFKSFLEGDPTDPNDDTSPVCLCKAGEVS